MTVALLRKVWVLVSRHRNLRALENSAALLVPSVLYSVCRFVGNLRNRACLSGRVWLLSVSQLVVCWLPVCECDTTLDTRSVPHCRQIPQCQHFPTTLTIPPADSLNIPGCNSYHCGKNKEYITLHNKGKLWIIVVIYLVFFFNVLHWTTEMSKQKQLTLHLIACPIFYIAI